MSSQKEISVHLLIVGKVQSVFFRSTLKAIADKNNVRGWARNLDDGSVEALLQGSTDEVNSVIEWCKNGPRNARVDSVRTEEIILQESHRNFVVLA